MNGNPSGCESRESRPPERPVSNATHSYARLPGWAWLVLLVVGWFAMPGGTAEPEAPPFRVGFSVATFGEVNENDATAAVKAWARALVKERGIAADPQPRILRGVTDLITALTNRLVDAISLTAEEYWVLRQHATLSYCIVSTKDGSIDEEYVILVHTQSGITNLAGLRGRNLAYQQGPRAGLATIWLETLLLDAGLGFPSNLCRQATGAAKVSKAVLPVFFRQLDACVVTRKAFVTMAELNPQVGQQLRVLAESSPVVPFLFCFRGDYTSPLREQLRRELTLWTDTPAGQQILTIFQGDSLEERPLSCLNNALDLVTAHRRLSAEHLLAVRKETR